MFYTSTGLNYTAIKYFIPHSRCGLALVFGSHLLYNYTFARFTVSAKEPRLTVAVVSLVASSSVLTILSAWRGCMLGEPIGVYSGGGLQYVALPQCPFYMPHCHMHVTCTPRFYILRYS